ncbi:MupA/Atu3671 family FMN-dependent luciferase-like monooxygenase [Streptomyces sp. NPDC056987]|uniref:MupA/Atu3671 family FMN-dependent luciferase-like monooxygenase n=1 Tax=Streptomyces sp. NPDC056987 TaxID=3345988 RepID=UPI003633238A
MDESTRGTVGPEGRTGPSLGLYFFSALEENVADADGYRLLLDAARAADDQGLRFVWVPERHFTPFGGGHPNPAVLAAAIAAVTHSVRIRAGSVVLPLHDPLRVAEEWAVVDNLSGGRAEISSATGWNARDFVLAPENFTDRAERARHDLRTVQDLWRGNAVRRKGPDGVDHTVRTYPRPVQPGLPCWITATGNTDTFAYAGELGAGLLTGYGAFTTRQLGECIGAYRRAYAAHHGGRGRVCVMAHAAIGASGEEMRRRAEGPLRRYLAAFLSQGDPPADTLLGEKRLVFAAQLHLRGRSLIGDRAEALETVHRMHAVGADEIACLVDFGLPRQTVLDTVAELAAIHAHLS